jgi:hypothetical protein
LSIPEKLSLEGKPHPVRGRRHPCRRSTRCQRAASTQQC